jgi:hypothetical protein
MSEIIMLTNTRLSFPQLVEPKSFQEGSPKKYSADLIIDPASEDWKKIMGSIMAVAQEKWKDQAQAVLGMIQNDRRLRCFGKGDEKISKTKMTVYEGYPGSVYISVSNANPPQAIDASGKAADPANTMAYMAVARKCYGGCRINAAVRFYCQDNQFGRGIRGELIAFQFAKDDTPFGDGDTDASSLFGAVTAPAATGGTAFPAFLT